MAQVLEKLFTAVKVGDLTLKHRVAMSAMTRLRNDPITEAPREINKTYYEQRSSDGGLLITEGSAPVAEGRGYIRAPNMYQAGHIDAWKPLVEGVHAKGGFIFAQLMHAGRVSHSSLLPGGMLPLSPSPVQMAGQLHVPSGKADYEVPQEISLDQIKAAVAGFATAAKNAIEAGFDGVELHGGNGYLIQSFLAQKTNLRTDAYGGSVENRARFLLEVVDACIAAVGASRVAVKLQQGVTFSDLIETEEDSFAQLAYLGPQLDARKIAFVDLSSLNTEPYYKFAGLSAPNFTKDVFKFFRTVFGGVIGINGALQPDVAAAYVADGTADFAIFGALFISNANLPALIKAGSELNMGCYNAAVWYGRDPNDDAKGYTDWPLVEVAA